MTTKRIHARWKSARDFDPKRKKERTEQNRAEWKHSDGFVPKFVIEIKLRINASLYYTCTRNKNTHRKKETERERERDTSYTQYWKLNLVHDDESIENNTKIRYAFDVNIIRWYLRGCVCLCTQCLADTISCCWDFLLLIRAVVIPKMFTFTRCRHSPQYTHWIEVCFVNFQLNTLNANKRDTI